MITLNVNGEQLQADVDADTPILWVLRDSLGMTGTKFGCGMALCAACTVHLEVGAPDSRWAIPASTCRTCPARRRRRQSTVSSAVAIATFKMFLRFMDHPLRLDWLFRQMADGAPVGRAIRVRPLNQLRTTAAT